jgi:HSP20 family protein
VAQVAREKNAGLARTDPLTEFERLHSELSRFLEGDMGIASLIRDGFTPLADVEETDDAYVIEMELPGVKKDDIEISMEGRRLIVQGERKEKERNGVLRRRTRSVGRFYFEVTLPGDVNENDVSASLDGGVLTLRVPKADATRPRKIEVR